MGKQGRVVMKQAKGQPNNTAIAAALQSMQDDVPTVPALPDKTISMKWPDVPDGMMDLASFTVIYPNYIDSSKTLAQGRRISKEHACESPAIYELVAVCQQLKLWHALEPFKGYPREPYVMGRVKVRLTLPDGTPANPDVPDKMALLKRMGSVIPDLTIRHERLRYEKEAKLKAQLEAQQQQKGKSATTAGTAASTNNKKKKKGKK